MFIAVDTGGTFTDLVGFDPAGGRVHFTKTLTTHDDPVRAMLACVEKVGLDLAACTLFKHGTTKVINLLLERSGPRVALVATRGFADVLEIGRGNRTEPFNLFFRRDPPLVPTELRFAVDERIDAQGRVLQAPDRAEVEALAARIAAAGVSAVAVSFINAYVDPTHERLVAEQLSALLPGCYVTAGSALAREWYEYERASTAAANAYAGPEIGHYVANLERAFGARGFRGRLFLMGSNGGVLSPRYAAQAPIMLVESGPVGGCIGAEAYAKALGLAKLIAFDMGGTTAKCAIIDRGIEVTSTYYIGGYDHGIPIRVPVVDIVEVGAGGGSIAWLDAQRQLHVGPRSAGSSPGPVAYARGGTEPTVTDANLILGRIDAASFQGGEMMLDVAAARRALDERLAQALGYAGDAGHFELASGILSIAAAKMSEAVKRVSVEKGHDPAELALFAYGGGGPLHAVELARELAIPTVIIPPEAGNFSAIGMLLADLRRDESRTFVRALDDAAMDEIARAFERAEDELRGSLEADIGGVPITFQREVSVRYIGQYHTVRVPFDTSDATALRRSFESVYRLRYGHARAAAPAETVSLHAVALAATPKPAIERLAGPLPQRAPAHSRSRPIVFPEGRTPVSAAVYKRHELPIGFTANGPAVIEEYGSTTLVGPVDRFAIGALGEIRIAVATREGGGRRA